MKIRSPLSVSFLAMIGVLLVNVYLCPSAGLCKQFQSAIRSDSFNLDGALQRVALKFFPPEDVGIPYFVKMEKRIELHSNGVEYEIYSVQKNYVPIGSFVRYKVFSDSTSRADLALLINNGVIEKVEPLRISAIEGKPFLKTGALFDSLAGCKIPMYSEPLSKLFKSLVYLEQISENIEPSGPVMNDKAGRAFSKALFDSLPKPSGDCPEFKFTTINGKEIKKSDLNGKGLLLVWGSFSDKDSREMVKLVSSLMETAGNKVVTIFIFIDHTEEMNAYADRGGVLPDNCVLDWLEEHKASFVVPVVPYLVGYNNKGKLLLSSLYYGKDKITNELSKFNREALK